MITPDTNETIGQIAGADQETTNHLRLWASVLHLALQDYAVVYQGNACVSSDPAVQRHPAAQWIFNDDTDPGTFTWVCEVLSLDPTVVRNNFLKHASNSRWVGRGYVKFNPSDLH